jgi:hypothetical protein
MQVNEFKQVVLGKGGARLNTWIDATFAHVDKPVRVRLSGVWDDGWIVLTVGTFTRTAEDMHRHKETREAWALRKGPRPPDIEGWY